MSKLKFIQLWSDSFIKIDSIKLLYFKKHPSKNFCSFIKDESDKEYLIFKHPDFIFEFELTEECVAYAHKCLLREIILFENNECVFDLKFIIEVFALAYKKYIQYIKDIK